MGTPGFEGAQYSFYFSCPLAAVHGIESLQPIDPERLTDPQALKLAARIELVADDEFSTAFPASTPCRVVMDQGHGAERMTVNSPLGDVANPMSQGQIIDKFRRISAENLDFDVQNAIIQTIGSLRTDGFSPLFAALRPR